MNEHIESILAGLDIDLYTDEGVLMTSVLVSPKDLRKFAEEIVAEMHRKVIANILITDVLMEEKGQKPTSEDYIRAINKDFRVEP